MIPGDRQQLSAATLTFAGVPPIRGSEAEAPEWFLWRDFQGKHVALAPNDEKALAADAHVLIVYGNNQFAVVGLIAPIEVSPN